MSSPTRSPQLSRSISASSMSSLDSNASVQTTSSADLVDSISRRTRKRFTNAQLMMLETLYHNTSHPTREQRDALAKEGDMETRSVTIWFQNKRQTERRAHRGCLCGPAIHHALCNSSPFTVTCGKTIHTARAKLSVVDLAKMTSSVLATEDDSMCLAPSDLLFPAHSPLNPAPLLQPLEIHKRRTPMQRHLSLDDIATRRERPYPLETPPRRICLHLRTPPKTRGLALWESMPSSPPGPAVLPAADHDLLDFGRRRLKRMRTLEWACAAARAGGHDGKAENGEEDENMLGLDLGGDTEDEGEAHEAVTPKTVIASRPGRKCTVLLDADKENQPVRIESTRGLETGMDKVRCDLKEDGVGVTDQDMMNAALALCGLGRQT